MKPRAVLAAALLCLAGTAAFTCLPGTAAFAADHPPYVPTRDVAVAYRLQLSTGPKGEQSVRMAYTAASGRVRIEASADADSMLPGYMLIDLAEGRLIMVVDQMRTFMEMPFDARTGAALMLSDKMAFSRHGMEKVAGLLCTSWDVTSGQTHARLCITADGVILHAEGSDPKRGEGRLDAVSVSYTAQPANLFVPPAGYHKIEMPKRAPG
jgi:hypothetical protein